MTSKILHAACAAIFIVSLWFIVSSTVTPRPTATPSVSKNSRPGDDRRNRVEHQLAECDRKVAELIRQQLQSVRSHFTAARQRVPRFSAAALGLRSKLFLMADWVPGSDVSHQMYLKELFEKEVTSGEALEQLVRHIVRTTADEIDGLEGALLVDLALDLPDRSPGGAGSFIPKSERLRTLHIPLRQQVATDLRRDIGREVAAYAAGEALTVGMGRMGVSAGLRAPALARAGRTSASGSSQA